jgi:hypothetical protein
MKKLFQLSILIILFSCNNKKEAKLYPSPKKLNNISISGKFYNGEELETKLHKIIKNSPLDTFSANEIFNRIEFFKEKYNPASDEFGLTQIPSNFLFLDINNDKTEDVIFQSNGPFITDSHAFLFFISNNKNKYKLVRGGGQIIDIQIIEEFCCATASRKEKYLKVDYFSYGCCDNPWDSYITGILNLNTGLFSDELYTISLNSINRTAEEFQNGSKKE